MNAVMSADQRAAVKGTLELFAWACDHPDQVRPVWDDLQHVVVFAAVVATDVSFVAKEDLLYNVVVWARSTFPVSIHKINSRMNHLLR